MKRPYPNPNIKFYENSPKYSAGWVMKAMLEKWDREKEERWLRQAALENSNLFQILNTSNAIKRHLKSNH